MQAIDEVKYKKSKSKRIRSKESHIAKQALSKHIQRTDAMPAGSRRAHHDLVKISLRRRFIHVRLTHCCSVLLTCQKMKGPVAW